MKIRGDITFLPFKNDSFNLVTSNMVVEHLHDPQEQFKEIYRVLMDKGLFIFHTPNIFSHGAFFSRLMTESIKKALIKLLEGREEDDVFKTYHIVNSKRKVMKISRQVGFVIYDFKLVIEPVARFKKLPVIAFFELLYLKLLASEFFKKARTNIICILQKPSSFSL